VNKRERGLSLVEMLIALAIFSILAVSVSSIFRAGVKIWRAGELSMEKNQKVRNIFYTMGRDLKNAVAYSEDMPFEGAADKLSFMTVVPALAGPAGAGHDELARVVYYFDETKNTFNKKVAGRAQGFDEKAATEIEIDSGVESAHFQYVFKPAFEGDGYEWRDQWKSEKKIPRGVKITIDGLETAVFLPLGALGGEEDETDENP